MPWPTILQACRRLCTTTTSSSSLLIVNGKPITMTQVPRSSMHRHKQLIQCRTRRLDDKVTTMAGGEMLVGPTSHGAIRVVWQVRYDMFHSRSLSLQLPTVIVILAISDPFPR